MPQLENSVNLWIYREEYDRLIHILVDLINWLGKPQVLAATLRSFGAYQPSAPACHASVDVCETVWKAVKTKGWSRAVAVCGTEVCSLRAFVIIATKTKHGRKRIALLEIFACIQNSMIRSPLSEGI